MNFESLNENTIFDYLLSRDIHTNESHYIDSLQVLDNYINHILETKYKKNLFDIDKLSNIDSTWINVKYKQLLQLQLNLDLITDNIIKLMENN